MSTEKIARLNLTLECCGNAAVYVYRGMISRMSAQERKALILRRIYMRGIYSTVIVL